MAVGIDLAIRRRAHRRRIPLTRYSGRESRRVYKTGKLAIHTAPETNITKPSTINPP